ncbi:hypothetical protein MRX96_024820 [Rhipicephalus microplus]
MKCPGHCTCWTPSFSHLCNGKCRLMAASTGRSRNTSFPVGEPLRLSVLLRNVSQGSFHHLWLSAVGYQDRQNGTLSYRLDSKAIFVESGASEMHEFTLAFLLTGVYKLELSCRAQEVVRKNERVWKCCPPIEITVAPPKQ